MKRKKILSPAEEALVKIALLGDGLKEDIKDWSNIGKGAVRIAQQHLAGCCSECGRDKFFNSQFYKAKVK